MEAHLRTLEAAIASAVGLADLPHPSVAIDARPDEEDESCARIEELVEKLVADKQSAQDAPPTAGFGDEDDVVFEPPPPPAPPSSAAKRKRPAVNEGSSSADAAKPPPSFDAARMANLIEAIAKEAGIDEFASIFRDV